MIRILICEDEELVSNRLMRFVKEVIAPPVRIDRVYTFREAEACLKGRDIDLLFLDLNLHGRDGYGLLRSSVAGPFHTIVVSAYTDRALEAFEYGVLDFVGKPFKKERIAKAINRYLQGIPSQERHVKRLAISGKKGLEYVAIERIKFIRAAGIYAELHLFDGGKKLYDKPLNQLVKILPGAFCRVHRSYVVNMTEVQSVQKIRPNSFLLVLESGDTIPLSRSRRKEILELLSRY